MKNALSKHRIIKGIHCYVNKGLYFVSGNRKSAKLRIILRFESYIEAIFLWQGTAKITNKKSFFFFLIKQEVSYKFFWAV